LISIIGFFQSQNCDSEVYNGLFEEWYGILSVKKIIF
jgi:hypothetical protein